MKENTPPDLPAVTREIVNALLAGDWTRYSDDSGSHYYYIIREQDYGVEVDAGRAFANMLSFDKKEPDAFEHWYVRAALAEEPADRLSKARKKFVAAGGDLARFDKTIAEFRVDKTGPKDILERFNSNVDALLEFASAIQIERTREGHVFVSESDRPELRKALEARFLWELTEKFPKVVKRAAEFDWLSFRDPQLREATRCYLYGFRRAAILVAVAALERCLKTVAGDKKPFAALVDSVFGIAGVCDHDVVLVCALTDLYKFRGAVVHEGREPQQEEATNALILVRDTIAKLKRNDEVA